MPRPSDNALPFPLVDRWPVALPGCVVTIRETGVALGSLLLEDKEWHAMRTAPVFSLRIDDHPIRDGWTSSGEFEIPLNPVVVPLHALASGRSLSDWVMHNHGASGRLLLWDDARRWWMAQESDLELVVSCAPREIFASASQALSWLPFGSATGLQAVDELRVRYAVTWDE